MTLALTAGRLQASGVSDENEIVFWQLLFVKLLAKSNQAIDPLDQLIR